jgi:hypothetical protein
MKKLVFVLFALLVGLNNYGQMRRDFTQPVRTNSEPTKQQIEKRDRMMKERREEFIANFMSTLEADEFQKVIIKQHLDSFYEAKLAILKTRFEHRLDREAAVKKLEDTHFVELEGLITEGDMKKIKDMVRGGFDEKEFLKEKKKEKRKKKKKGKIPD